MRVRTDPASPLDPERAMRKNEHRDTVSQAKNSTVTSSARTRRRIDVMNVAMNR